MYINNLVYFDLEIDNIDNFLKYEDLLLFEMTETAGATLPYFKICFKTKNLTVRNSIIENNVVRVALGTSPNDADIFEVSLIDEDKEENSEGNYFTISISGYLNNKKFLVDKKQGVYKGTSLDVIRELSNEYFNGLDSSISSTRELPNKWLRVNDTANIFLSEAWLHMDIQPNFPLLAISRNNKVILRDKDYYTNNTDYIFSHTSSDLDFNKYLFMNNFNLEKHKSLSNLFSGYGKLVNILNYEDGEYESYMSSNDTILSVSKDSETSGAGSKVLEGIYSTENTHKTYYTSYYHNTSNLVNLSSVIGRVDLPNIYIKDMNLLDSVYLDLNGGEPDSNNYGKYVINTIQYTCSYNTPFTTRVYLCRDNVNNLEDYIISKEEGILTSLDKKTFIKNIRNSRKYYNLLRKYSSNETLSLALHDYLYNLKYQVLSSFNVSGVNINLNTKYTTLSSFRRLGEELARNLLDQYIPTPYNDTLKSVLLDYGTFRQKVEIIITEHLPSGVDVVAIDLFNYLINILEKNKEVETVFKNNLDVGNIRSNDYLNNSITFEDTLEGLNITEIKEVESLDENIINNKVNNITDSFLENIKGVDAPLPIIALTESERLLPDTELKELIATKVEESLISKGYLIGITNFKEILMGQDNLDFNTINIINNNVSDNLKTRHWGAFTSISQFTNYFLMNTFKDKYKTLETSKLINARGGKRIFIALPEYEADFDIYINSVKVNLDSITVSTGYLDTLGKRINYNVYYTEDKFNSNSVLLEVKNAN